MKTACAALVLLAAAVPAGAEAVTLTGWNQQVATGTFDGGMFVAPTVQVIVWRTDTVPASFVSHAAERILPGNGWEAVFYPNQLPAGVPLFLQITLTEGEVSVITGWSWTF